MTLTNTKIVFILLLTASLSACSVGDDDDASSSIDDKSGMQEMLAKNCILLPGDCDPSSGLDSLSNDTLKVFPDDMAFHKLLMQCLVSAQGMVKIIMSSIDASVIGRGANNWMNYYEPYLGVYLSYNDSRSKQWNLEQDIPYDGKTWNYHLSILDLPEGATSSNKGERAVEVFYDDDFEHGMMVFSPTDFDVVRFPKKIFGPDIKGALTFVHEGGTTTNELFLTNIGVNNNVKYIRNVYLRTESFDNGYVSIMAMIDFPALWFDDKNNSGYTVSIVGAYDIATRGAVLYSGIVRNSCTDKSVSSLVTEHPSVEVLDYYYPLWHSMMMEDSVNNFSLDEPNDNNESGKYGMPGYYMDGKYVPGADVGDKTPYLKALNKCLDMMSGDFPISPYKNSVNQVEWMVVEKSR